MDRKQLTKAAKELNEVMGLEGKDKIKTVAVKTAALQDDIKDAASELDPKKDTLTDETLKVLEALEIDVSGFETGDEDEPGEDQEPEEETTDGEDEEEEPEPEQEEEVVEIGTKLTKDDKAQAIKVAEDLVKTLDYPKDLLKKMKKMSFKKLLAEIASIAEMINQPYEDEDSGATIQPDDKKSDFKKATASWLEKADIKVKWESDSKEEKPEPEKKDSGKAAKDKDKKKSSSKTTEKSVYGHKLGSQAAKIDDLIAEGKHTLEEIAEKLDVKNGRVTSHIKHLIDNKKLNVQEDKKGRLSVK